MSFNTTAMPFFVMETHHQDDGSINYEVWDYCTASFRRVCVVSTKNALRAKEDAILITHALNRYMETSYERREHR